MDYQQALDYLYSFLDYEKEPVHRSAEHYDLRRVYEVLSCLGDPHLKAKSVHIAGTKGKGSTSAMIASALTASGYKTALYTSPHLIDVRERFRIDGGMISEAQLLALTEEIKPAVDEVNRKATYGALTTFEVLTALGFYYFMKEKVGLQVLEVGLGGRLDATNVIIPEVSVITSISFDHMEVLGDTLAKIAREKAGIIKEGGVVVTSPQRDEPAQVFSEICRERHARQVQVGHDVNWQSFGSDLSGQQFIVKGRLGTYKLTIPLLGRHQLDNTATAVAALEVLIEKGYHISPDSIARGLAGVSWPGRLQILRRDPLLVVDGAHNVDSAYKLVQALREYFQFDKPILVMGVSFDKDIPGIVSELAPFFEKVVVTRSSHPRAMRVEALQAEFARHGVKAEVAGTVAEAIPMAFSIASPRDLVCVTGSLFVVGEAIEYMQRSESG